MLGSLWAATSPRFSARSTELRVGATVPRASVTQSSLLNPQSSALRGLSVSALLLLHACSSARFSTEPGAPTLVLPGSFAEGKAEPAASSAPAPSAAPPGAASASASAAPVAAPLTPSTLPDPTPLRMAEQVEYELELSEGKIRVVSVKALTLPAPIETPRRLGRYALELRIGPELIERVRFDCPGTAADEPQAPGKQKLYAPLTLGARAIARVKLLLPQSPRVRQAVLVDRGLNTATELQWLLPEVPKAPVAPSASAVVPTAPAVAAPAAKPAQP